jgi:hypothetical protein
MVKAFRLKTAVAVRLEVIVRVQVGEVPVHPPDQPAKAELPSGTALKVTPVPGLKSVPAGETETVPLPVPVLLTASWYCGAACWVMERRFPAMARVPLREEGEELEATE